MSRENTPKEKQNHVNTTVFVIYEGYRTEREYFEHFENKHRNWKFKFSNVEKKSFDRNNTIKGELVQLVKGESVFMATGNHTAYHFCTVILDKYSELIGLDADLENFNDRIERLSGDLINKAQSAGMISYNRIFDMSGFLDLIISSVTSSNKQFDNARLRKNILDLGRNKNISPFELIKRSLGYFSDISKDNKAIDKENSTRCKRLLTIRNDSILAADESVVKDGIVHNKEKMLKIVLDLISQDAEYDPEYRKELSNPDIWDKSNKTVIKGDRTFVVFDRDYDLNRYDETRTDDYYRGVFKECESLGYEVLLSTPDFEIWLLMHHDGVDYSEIGYTDRKQLNEILCKLENIDPEKIKVIDERRFNTYYYPTFEKAVECSRQFDTELEPLLTKIGSNVGLKLKSLL